MLIGDGATLMLLSWALKADYNTGLVSLLLPADCTEDQKTCEQMELIFSKLLAWALDPCAKNIDII